MAGTREGALKAVQTRKEHDKNAFVKMGQARQDMSPEKRSAIAKKAADTRKQHDPEAFVKMGEKGGSQGKNHGPNAEGSH